MFAGKWAARKVSILVASDSIRIADDGPGMTLRQISTAFEIGTRFDRSRPGSGLGLPIARDIADAYGLSVLLAPQDAETGGLGVIITASSISAH